MPSDRHPMNAPGRFYVDHTCIACDTCTALAPDHFSLDPTHTQAYVTHQPTSPTEIDNCELALAQCPVGAIGSE